MIAIAKANSTTLLVVLSLVSLTLAHSPVHPTIAYSESIRSLHHDTAPRSHSHQLGREHPAHASLSRRSSRNNNNDDNASSSIVRSGDTLRVQLSAFGQTFFLHLEPNLGLIHPDLTLASQSFGVNKDEEIKAFKGIVIQDEELSRQRWQKTLTATTDAGRNKGLSPLSSLEHALYEQGVLGWARMMIEHGNDDNDGNMVLRGAFTVEDDTYHVTTREHYHVQKRSDDHTPASQSPGHSLSPSSELVIYRDSDLVKLSGTLNKRDDNEGSHHSASCGTDGSLLHSRKDSQLTEHGYYYPPDLTSSMKPTEAGAGGISGMFRISSYHHPLRKREDNSISPFVTVKVAGPNPIPTGCPTTRQINYMGVAADCTYVRAYGGLENARKQILADFNTASAIYESTFNIALGIVRMQIESMNCPATPIKGKLWNQKCSTNYTIGNRLSDFSHWRGLFGKSTDGAGLWHLMTDCNTGAVAGVAWTKSLCESGTTAQGSGNETQYTSGTGVSTVSPTEWMVVAHEVGHGFGASHDCTAATCVSTAAISDAACCPFSETTCDANDKYIMNPSEQSSTKIFSPCSINAICNTIASQGTCLQVPSVSQFTQSTGVNVCGNGIREAGEQCDCGTPEECTKDPCCDGTTCKLKGTAVCDDLNDDCCQNCQIATKGRVCRSAISSCDIEETCTGTSTICPPDLMYPDLMPCTIFSDVTTANGSTGGRTVLGQGQCAHGICTSRDLQCAQLQRPGITHQCTALTSGCELLCNDPNGSLDSCLKIPGMYFEDGSPCGSSGTESCRSGKCVLPGGWARNHLQILIPVVCGIILLVGTGVGWWVWLHRKKKRVHVECHGPSGAAAAGTSVSSSFSSSLSSSSSWFRRRDSKDFGSAGGSKSISKDAEGPIADVPKWMISSDRRMSTQIMTQKTNQTVVSRRAQNLLRNSEGDMVQVPNRPEASYVQSGPHERAPSRFGGVAQFPDPHVQTYEAFYQQQQQQRQQQQRQRQQLGSEEEQEQGIGQVLQGNSVLPSITEFDLEERRRKREQQYQRYLQEQEHQRQHQQQGG